MTKKYILKPGTHQFAPGSAAVHSNDNLTDEEAEWYLQRYPHIAKLFEKPEERKSGSPKDEKSGVKPKRTRIPKNRWNHQNQNNPINYENLLTTN